MWALFFCFGKIESIQHDLHSAKMRRLFPGQMDSPEHMGHLSPKEYACALLACLFLFWDKISSNSPGTSFRPSSLHLPPECWYHRRALFSATELLVKSILWTPDKLFLEGQLLVHFRKFLWTLSVGLQSLPVWNSLPLNFSNFQGWWEEKAGFPRRQYPSPQIILWWIKCLMFPFVQGYKRNNWGESPSDTCAVWETCGCTSLFCNAPM